VKKLLILALSISCVSFIGSASSPSVEDPHSSIQSAITDGLIRPHLDIPKNCVKTDQADGSVLLTCDCEACGKPEARDGLNPLPWGCEVEEQTVICGYDVGRKKLHGLKETHI
jgi:hypothetical protein